MLFITSPMGGRVKRSPRYITPIKNYYSDVVNGFLKNNLLTLMNIVMLEDSIILINLQIIKSKFQDFRVDHKPFESVGNL